MDNVYKKVGFQDKLGDAQLLVYTRINVLQWACKFGHENCVRNAIDQFKAWRNSADPDRQNPISPNLKSVVYCTAIQMGGQDEWDFTWERYKASNVGSEKALLLVALGCTKETWLLNRYLQWSVTNNTGIRKQDAFRVYRATSNNRIGQSLTFTFLRNKWDLLNE